MRILRNGGYIFFSSKYVDFISLTDTKYIQYGRFKRRFVLVLKRSDAPIPMTFTKRFWKIKVSFWRIRLGETTKPLQINRIMENAYGIFRGKKPVREQRVDTISKLGLLRIGRDIL